MKRDALDAFSDQNLLPLTLFIYGVNIGNFAQCF